MATKTSTPIAICPGVNGGGSPAVVIIIIVIRITLYKAITKSIIKMIILTTVNSGYA